MSRSKIAFAALLAVSAMPVLALASPFPFDEMEDGFQPGTAILAQDFNDRFSEISVAINDNDARISALEAPPELIVVRASNTVATNIGPGSTTIPFNDEEEDSHNAYNSVSGVFTCPRPALLQASYNVFMDNLIAGNARLLVVEGPGHEYELKRLFHDYPQENLAASLAFRCEALGDEWTFRASCDQPGGCQTLPQSGLRTFSNLSIVEVR